MSKKLQVVPGGQGGVVNAVPAVGADSVDSDDSAFDGETDMIDNDLTEVPLSAAHAPLLYKSILLSSWEGEGVHHVWRLDGHHAAKSCEREEEKKQSQ